MTNKNIILHKNHIYLPVFSSKSCLPNVFIPQNDNEVCLQEQILKLLEEVGRGEVAGVPVRPILIYRRVPIGFEKARESHLVVAALIATVTFSAAFTIPGGYKNERGTDQGTAILIRNAVFNMFVISDAIAVVSSLLAVLFYFLMARPRSQKSFVSYPYAYRSTILAVGAMEIGRAHV